MSHIRREVRQRVTGQAHHRCGYCLTQEMVVGTPMEIDHLIPSSLGGTDDEQNLWLACSLCNDYKGDRIAGIDPLTGEVARLFNPASKNGQITSPGHQTANVSWA
jgi:5-methylcytosine-specific restriction endonuclease McrA